MMIHSRRCGSLGAVGHLCRQPVSDTQTGGPRLMTVKLKQQPQPQGVGAGAAPAEMTMIMTMTMTVALTMAMINRRSASCRAGAQ